jgi:hypothetical protein
MGDSACATSRDTTSPPRSPDEHRGLCGNMDQAGSARRNEPRNYEPLPTELKGQPASRSLGPGSGWMRLCRCWCTGAAQQRCSRKAPIFREFSRKNGNRGLPRSSSCRRRLPNSNQPDTFGIKTIGRPFGTIRAYAFC